MTNKESLHKTQEDLERELEELRYQLQEANDTIEAIRTGQIDALVVQSDQGPQLFTLKSADQTYRFFIEKMAEGAVKLNSKGIILYSNSQFARMLHLPLSQVIGIHFVEFVAPENKLQYKELFDTSWKSACKGELLLMGEESYTPVQLSLTTLELEEGVSLSIIITDLTAQKATQLQLKMNNEQLEEINQALESSNHDLQQFASVASHDLQEPVRKIQIFSNLLKDKQTDLNPESKKYIDKIIISSTRMKALIVDILTYSRLSANHNHSELVNLNELMNELLEDFELIIQDKKAEVNIDPLDTIEVNRGQLRQVFQNIISNALKFSKPGEAPVINIKTQRISHKSFDSPEQKEGPYCLICIRDNGIGFDERYLANIFALFERLNAKDNYEGSGIGLAIAKKIIDKHNGLITAKSKVEKGTEFKMILPVSQNIFKVQPTI
jgi:signal transduction histidine kinase